LRKTIGPSLRTIITGAIFIGTLLTISPVMASATFWIFSLEPGSRIYWDKGTGPGSLEFWLRGTGPGSKYYWERSSQSGSRDYWLYGTGSGSRIYWENGDGPGSRRYWIYGDTKSGVKGPGSMEYWQYGVQASFGTTFVAMCMAHVIDIPPCELMQNLQLPSNIFTMEESRSSRLALGGGIGLPISSSQDQCDLSEDMN
jgi:hypothetical protein